MIVHPGWMHRTIEPEKEFMKILGIRYQGIVLKSRFFSTLTISQGFHSLKLFQGCSVRFNKLQILYLFHVLWKAVRHPKILPNLDQNSTHVVLWLCSRFVSFATTVHSLWLHKTKEHHFEMRTSVATFLIGLALVTVPTFALGARAHAICRDHTISYSTHRQGTCSWHKGVLKWLY